MKNKLNIQKYLLAAALIHNKLKYFRINRSDGEVLEINYMTDSCEWGFCYKRGEYIGYNCDPDRMIKRLYHFMSDDCTFFLKENIFLPMSLIAEKIKNMPKYTDESSKISVKEIVINLNNGTKIRSTLGTLQIGVDTN